MTSTHYANPSALRRPILMGFVEKRLVLVNLLLNFLVIASCQLQVLTLLLSLGLFCILHALMLPLTRHDPRFSEVFKRATRYIFQPSYPARCHPNARRLPFTYSLPRC